MRKFILHVAFIIVLLPSIGYSQKYNTNNLYNEGLKYFNLKEYKKADSLFTISLLFNPHKDTYFNRAICQKKLLHIENYCHNLSMAVMLGDDEARKLYLTECGTIDTVYFDKNNSKVSKDKFELMEVKFNSGFKDLEITYVYNSKQILYTKYKMFDSIGKVYLTTDLPPEHEGSESDFFWYTKKNLHYPQDVKKIGKSVFIHSNFIVSEQGKILKITSMRSSEKCIECFEEAEKFIKGIPKWKPGKINNIPVQSIGFISLKFDIERAYK
jgi:hypothetical protein